jgi:hypothetical protein
MGKEIKQEAQMRQESFKGGYLLQYHRDPRPQQNRLFKNTVLKCM